MEIKQDVAHADLAEHLPRLRAMVDKAVTAYRQDYDPSLKRIHSDRSRASVIHDHFVHCAAEYAESTSDVQLRESSHLWLLVFAKGYVIRFKKLDKRRRSAGHLTKQVRKFRCQQQLDGFSRAINLDLGYQLDVEGKVHAVFLTCPSGVYSKQWDSLLSPDGVKPVVVSLFGGTPSPSGEMQGGKITAKKRGVKNETESGDGNSGS